MFSSWFLLVRFDEIHGFFDASASVVLWVTASFTVSPFILREDYV
jgi:hypothetical protein